MQIDSSTQQPVSKVIKRSRINNNAHIYGLSAPMIKEASILYELQYASKCNVNDSHKELLMYLYSIYKDNCMYTHLIDNECVNSKSIEIIENYFKELKYI